MVPLFIYLLSHPPSPATFPTPPNPVPGAKGQWGENSLRNAATKKRGRNFRDSLELETFNVNLQEEAGDWETRL